MKKTFFYISLSISIILFVNIITILTTELDRLTQYGYGYLTGKIILFLIFGAIMLLTRKRKSKTTL